ncbi:hypothetical protein [Staphylococcus pettenkoferi]|uniref:hypothetical protein n=1 Tax=Staphylococcus pettenkoferi TaxID=170573 RepID=UPI00255422FA|nr:hypothetical protein [Staphylococcus pettenkoferi]MDK7284461.1 hypothetical protein [Staphylococcus pettenkoferi]
MKDIETKQERVTNDVLYGVWDKQQQQFKDIWVDYKESQALKDDFTDYMRDTLLLGSCLIDEELSDDELWEIFGYEIQKQNRA